MRAIILAAGRGGRLSGIVGDRPKCLARMGDCTLLEWQIRTLRALGVTNITVIAGFGATTVRRVCDADIQLLLNNRHATTNSLYSLWLARHLLKDGFIVLNCDVLFHPQLLIDLLSARVDDALLVSERGSAGPYSSEEMKVHMRRGLVCAISKTLDDEDCDGENVGIARFGADGAAILVEELNRLVTGGAVRDWLPRAFDAFCRLRPLHVVGTRGFPWIEIDFAEDYWRACSDVFPAIEMDECRRSTPETAAPPRRVRAGRTLHV